MLKTCSRCGIVPDNHICPYKPTKKIKTTANTVRQTNRWHQKSLNIRERDDFMCRVCRLNLYGTVKQYNSTDIEVHHIIPLEEDDTKAFEDNNLISLCRYHHEMAECGDIPRKELLRIVEENKR